jgi:bacillithiol system protein YtxJ
MHQLQTIQQLEEIIEQSQERPILIFKHSTRCSISAMAWDRLKRNWKSEDEEKVSLFYLDLITYRSISNTLAELFQVRHESPQVILIHQGKAIYNASHMGIQYQEIMERVSRM